MRHPFRQQLRSFVFAPLATLGLSVLMVACVGSPTSKSVGERLDDSAIATKLKSNLLADRTTDGLDIEVEVFKGRVQLNGFADSAAEVTRASDIARGIKGVESVENNLIVADPGSRGVGRYLDDKGIVARVKTALARNRDVAALEIEVEVNRGVVQLGGFVNDANQRQRAGDIVAAVGGVKRVANNIGVKGAATNAYPQQVPQPPAAPVQQPLTDEEMSTESAPQYN